MIRTCAAALVAAASLHAAAQSAPARDYSDIWWNADESGWGVTFTQHATHQVSAVWYTYDPRALDAGSAVSYKPLWIVMAGGTWTSPTTLTGDAYVTLGSPYQVRWNAASLGITRVGTFTFTFTGESTATFAYDIAPPGGLTAGSPAFGLPAFSGTKAITRQPF